MNQLPPELEPHIIEGPRQSVAVSSNLLTLKIGAVGRTPQEARLRWQEEYVAWMRLRERRLEAEVGLAAGDTDG